MPPRAQIRTVDLPNEPQPCPQADATRELAAEVRRLRLSVQAGIREAQPVIKSIKGWCAWWRKYGPWLIGSIPGVLVAIGALSPNAADALKLLLAAAGNS
jgi:hypothetical protein